MPAASGAVEAPAAPPTPAGTQPADAKPLDAKPGEPTAADAVPKENPRFDILEYRVVGNSVLRALDIEKAVYPHLGPGRTIKDVEGARAALEKIYVDKGYVTVLVDIPEQKVDSGVVTLRVTQGRIGRVRVTGSHYYSLGRIKDATTSAAPGTVPTLANLQRDLTQLARSADRRVTPLLKPGATPGTVDAEFKVEDKMPLHGDVEINNHRSPNTTPLRMSASIHYDNLFQLDHSMSLSVQTAPEKPKEAQIVSSTYVMPLQNSDKVFAFYGVHSKSNVAAIGSLEVLGNGNIFGARFIAPLTPLEGFSHSVTAGIDYKSFGEAVQLIGGDTARTPITYVPMSLQYSATWKGASRTTTFASTANFAVRDLFGKNRDSDFKNKRDNAHADYFFVKSELQHTEELPAGWSLAGKIDLQLASQPLISNEQFTAGGADTIRGYLEAEQVGDHALLGSIEARSPFVPFASREIFDELYALAFWEAADLRLMQPLPSQHASVSLGSVGVGLRMLARKKIRLALDVGYPLRDSTYTRAGDTRVQFKLGYEF